jgi:hypothetical protein
LTEINQPDDDDDDLMLDKGVPFEEYDSATEFTSDADFETTVTKYNRKKSKKSKDLFKE